MTINELIEQIGGRERLEAIVYAMGAEPCDADPILDSVTHGDIGKMARALLAVLDAQSKPALVLRPFGYDGETFRKSDIDHHAAVVYYTAPPAASVHDGWKIVPVDPTPEMLEEIWLDERFQERAMKARYAAMIAAAPAPGGDGG